ncbi:hypothetical protein Q644_00660 [Brucella intermedia 229E]|uniref:Uncharacterized protein n=1 Tax=Brucella intermedia 229E TaxID=1337887 RepID=U4VHA5_9HYPH|nr:hypothetical protein Q644_00660 [Brucella intermedia 229E]
MAIKIMKTHGNDLGNDAKLARDILPPCYPKY